MGSNRYNKRQEELYKKAASLASDGRFSKDDYESLSKDYGNVKGWMRGGKGSNLTRHIARALHENNAVLDGGAQELANKHNKGGLTQSRDSSGRLRTSFKQSTGGRNMIERIGTGNKESYEGEFAGAPISNIEKRNWTQHTPNGKSNQSWDVYTRTYTHGAEKEEPAVETTPTPEPEPEHQPSQELTDTRNQWDSPGTGGSIHYDPTSGKTGPGVVGGVGAAADYGNRATDDYQNRFIPQLNLQANLEALEIGDAGSRHLDRYEGKVPELASNDIKDLFEYYSKKITA